MDESFPSLPLRAERRRSSSSDTAFMADETDFLLPSASTLEDTRPSPLPAQSQASTDNSLSSSLESSQEHRLVKIRAQSPTWCHICTSIIWLTQPALNCKKCNLWIHKKCQPKVVNDCGQDMARIGFMKRVAGEHRVRVEEVHRMFKVVHEKTREVCTEYLQQIGLDIDLLTRLGERRVLLPEEGLIKEHLTRLTVLTENLPEELVERTRKVGVEESSRFLAGVRSLAHSEEYKKLKKDLDEMEWSQFALTKVALHNANCQLGLDQLAEIKRQLMDGTMKDKMVDTWLLMIESRTGEFLKHLGYDAEAVPVDYISARPQDMQAVRKNYKIIHAILDKEDVHNVKALVEDIKNKVYPIIDDFRRNAEYLVCQIVNISPEQFDLAEVASQIANTDDRALRHLVKDLEYIRKMKHLEAHPEERVLDVVPVGGLVVGTFVRLDNELKTVLMVWDPQGQGELEEKEKAQEAKEVKEKKETAKEAKRPSNWSIKLKTKTDKLKEFSLGSHRLELDQFYSDMRDSIKIQTNAELIINHKIDLQLLLRIGNGEKPTLKELPLLRHLESRLRGLATAVPPELLRDVRGSVVEAISTFAADKRITKKERAELDSFPFESFAAARIAIYHQTAVDSIAVLEAEKAEMLETGLIARRKAWLGSAYTMLIQFLTTQGFVQKISNSNRSAIATNIELLQSLCEGPTPTQLQYLWERFLEEIGVLVTAEVDTYVAHLTAIGADMLGIESSLGEEVQAGLAASSDAQAVSLARQLASASLMPPQEIHTAEQALRLQLDKILRQLLDSHAKLESRLAPPSPAGTGRLSNPLPPTPVAEQPARLSNPLPVPATQTSPSLRPAS